MEKYKVAFVSSLDINDRNSWSGTLYYCKRSLSKYFDIVDFSPLDDNLKYLFFPKKYILKKMFKKNYLPEKKKVMARYYSNQVRNLLKKYKSIDAIFCMGAIQTAYLKTRLPIISFTDSVYRDLLDYYDNRKNILESNKKESDMVEEIALQNADYLFFSSQWACNYAKSYNIDKNKVEMLTFGLNMDNIPDAQTVYEYINLKCEENKCNLLFIGKEWSRKGGDIAYAAFKYLKHKTGIPVNLQIIGCDPAIEDENVKIIKYIDKNNKAERYIYEEILKSAHFLVLPTRADCSSMVSIEANAYGIPSMITDTGGIPSILDNGVNGYMFDYQAAGEAYGKKIFEVFNNKEEFKKLCINSRKHYEEKTNWDRTGKILSDKIIELIEKNK